MSKTEKILELVETDNIDNLQIVLQMVINLICQHDHATINDLYNENFVNSDTFCEKKHPYLLNKIQLALVEYKFGNLKQKISNRKGQICSEYINEILSKH